MVLTMQPLVQALKSYLVMVTQILSKRKVLILTFPYIAGLSESIQRVCKDFDIETAYKSGKTPKITSH